MGIGFSPDNAGLLILLSLAALVVPFGLLWLVGLLLSALRIRVGCLPGAGAALALLGVAVVAPLAVDAVGQPLQAQVIQKTESVRVRSEGNWSDDLSLAVRYDVTGRPLPPFTDYAQAQGEVMAAGRDQEVVLLRPTPTDFDRVQVGDSVAVRVVRVREVFSLVTLVGRSTPTLLPWPTLAAWVGGGLLALLAWGARKTPLGYLPLGLLVLAGLAYPLVNSYQTWQAYEDLSAATARGEATVRDVTRVTEVNLCPRGGERCRTVLAQPYDIVQVEFVPPGPREREVVIGVDAVDAVPGSAGRFQKGAAVAVLYPPDAPREVRIVGERRTHYWQTMVSVYLDNALVLAVAAVFILLPTLFGRLWGRLKATRR